MNWDAIESWMLAAAIVFMLLGFLHKRKVRQSLRERYGSTPAEVKAGAEAKSALDRVAGWVLGWRGYAIVAGVLAVVYAVETEQPGLVVAVVLTALAIVTMAVGRTRRKREEIPRNPFDG